MATREIKLGSHRLNAEGEAVVMAFDVCPECGSADVKSHDAPDYGGDGERLWIENDCQECGTWWSDRYDLTARRVYTHEDKLVDSEVLVEALAKVEARGALPDGRSTIWIDGVEQELYSVEDALEIMADIHAATVARENIAQQDAEAELEAIEYLRV